MKVREIEKIKGEKKTRTDFRTENDQFFVSNLKNSTTRETFYLGLRLFPKSPKLFTIGTQ